MQFQSMTPHGVPAPAVPPAAPGRGGGRGMIARLVAALMGAGLVVLGGVALARVGFESLTDATALVWSFEHTALLALVDLALGTLLVLVAMATSRQLRTSLLGMAALMLAFSVILLIEPGILDSAFGGERPIAYLYLAVGTLCLAVSLVAPSPMARPAASA